MSGIIFLAGIMISLLASHFIAKAVERKLAGGKRQWVAKLVPLIALLVSFFAIIAAIVAILSYTVAGHGFAR